MKLMKKASVLTMTAVAAIGFTVGGSAQAADNKVVIAGSTALLPLTQQAAKEFKKMNPKAKISVSGSSSIAGPQSVLKGSATLGACDWDATKAVPGFKAFSSLKAHRIAAIPFAAIVSKSNRVSGLKTNQLQGIFSGKITNWKQVGGSDEPIVVVNRKVGSGTRVNFQMKGLKGAAFMSKGSNYKEVGKSGEMISAVSSNPNAIGFVDLAYVKGNLKPLAIDNVAATTGNVINGKYKIWSYGYLLSKGQLTGVNKQFVSYIQSNKFQNGSLKKMKFIPIKKMK